MSFHSTKSSRRRYRAGARASASASGVEPSEAAAQAEAADSWWRQNRPGSGDLFANELRGTDLIARAPGTGRVYPSRALPGVRRVALHRTRFHVYYVPREDSVTIVAVSSAVRGQGPSFTS